MKHETDAALGHAEPHKMHDDDAALLAELCEVGGSGLQTKSAAARPGLRGRAAPAGNGGDGDPKLQKDAIVAIGKAVLEQGKKIDGLVARRGLDTKRAHGLTHRTWHDFQEANDRRIAEIKRRGSADPLIEEKLARMNDELDMLQRANRLASLREAKANRPPGMGTTMNRGAATGPAAKQAAQAKFRKAVINWMRTGEESFEGESIKALQTKALHTELNPSGGYLMMPERADSPLSTFLTELSPMRQRATVRQISALEFQQPTRTGRASAGWVGERAERTETDTPTIGVDKHLMMELYAEPGATQTILDMATLDVEAWLAEEIAEAFALQESDAWFNGTGISQPRGMLTYPFVADASWAHGKFRYLATGVSGGFPAVKPDDKLIDLTYQIKAGYRNSASWMLTRGSIGLIRKFKDGEDRPLWEPSTKAGQPATLLGYAIDEDEYMPEVGADTYAVGFGDWRRTYLILDGIGVRLLRDPYTNKPFVMFYTTKHVGGGVQMFDAAAFLKFGN